MSKVYKVFKCDRCGNLEGEPHNWKFFNINPKPTLHYDLCVSCMKDFDIFMKNDTVHS